MGYAKVLVSLVSTRFLGLGDGWKRDDDISKLLYMESYVHVDGKAVHKRMYI